jgi:UDP-N-acetylmuramoylalanine--D-glutamate ligase
MSGSFAGERAVVVGFGVSGRAATAALLRQGATVVVSETRSAEQVLAGASPEEMAAVGLDLDEGRLELRAGGHEPAHLEDATVVVSSPGVPDHAPILAWARAGGIPIWSELELGARLCSAPVVAVTGTNGKTTTVELIAAAMRAAGLSARACGNVGYPFSIAATKHFDALAVEASSFQLRFTESLQPRVSVLLNLAPDHLDWHGTFDAYAQAKSRIFLRQSDGDVHVGNRDDAAAARISSGAPCTVRWFRSGRPNAGEVGIEEGRVVAAVDGTRTDLGGPARATVSLLADAAAAAAAALAFGLPAEAVRQAIVSFQPLPHRGAVVARAGDVGFVDDSKATNPHATLAALKGITNAVLIAGGRAKGVDLSALTAAAPGLVAVVAIGEAAPQLVTVFRGLVPVRSAGSIEEAVAVAFDEAPAGGTVILAPACASQDMFRDYSERGERFAAAARALAATAPGDRRRLHA